MLVNLVGYNDWHEMIDYADGNTNDSRICMNEFDGWGNGYNPDFGIGFGNHDDGDGRGSGYDFITLIGRN